MHTDHQSIKCQGREFKNLEHITDTSGRDRQVIRMERGEGLERNADCKCQLKANADGKGVGKGDALECHVRI